MAKLKRMLRMRRMVDDLWWSLGALFVEDGTSTVRLVATVAAIDGTFYMAAFAIVFNKPS